ncbi:unannotated protein [freshwater metagenome]|uniref:Unannotated protein n=1 Tax=freshwater metagenome TaxID=449393 RepID=A0A6J6A096_9ZZZZ
MNRIPAEALDRDLMDAERAGVVEAEDFNIAEVLGAKRAEFVRTVLVNMPRVAGAIGPLGRQRQHVGGRDVDGRILTRFDQTAAVIENLARISDVLNRLEKDDGIARLFVAVNQCPLEAEPGARVAGLGVGMSVGVGVDADNVGCAAR